MMPLMQSFEYRAAHELHHPVYYNAGSLDRDKYYEEDFKSARMQAIERIKVDPAIAAKVDQVLQAMKAMLQDQSQELLKIDFGWKRLDPDSREQLGVLLGVFLSHEFHATFDYISDAPFGRDHRFYEILSNVKALAHVFGEENVRSFAPELLDYANNLAEKRGQGTCR